MKEAVLYIALGYCWFEGTEPDLDWSTDPFIGLFYKRRARKWAKRNNVKIIREVDAWLQNP